MREGDFSRDLDYGSSLTNLVLHFLGEQAKVYVLGLYTLDPECVSKTRVSVQQ